jgi:hypothetical protein
MRLDGCRWETCLLRLVAGEGVVVSLLHADPRGLIVQNEAYDPRSDR